MFIIGLTGGIGVGKTVALGVLASLGVLTLDCDAIYHGLLSDNIELKAELEARYVGVTRNGNIDRKVLGEIVFSDPSALLELNAITHKYVSTEIERLISEWAEKGGKITAIEAIALIESGIAEKKCDVVVGVTAPMDTRISRITKRDRISREQAQTRINAQKPDSYYMDNCDYTLESNCAKLEEFENKCKAFFNDLLETYGY